MAKLLKNQVFKTTISYQKMYRLLKTLCHIDPCLEKSSRDQIKRSEQTRTSQSVIM